MTVSPFRKRALPPRLRQNSRRTSLWSRFLAHLRFSSPSSSSSSASSPSSSRSPSSRRLFLPRGFFRLRMGPSAGTASSQSQPASAPYYGPVLPGMQEGVGNQKVTHQFIVNNGITLHYVECGPPKGQLLLLLHGFPSFWLTWKNQFAALASAGFHVVAPDMRGYNLSSKPMAVAAYSMSHLEADVVNLILVLGGGKPALLVGHDWGGVICYELVKHHPALVSRMVIINAPEANSWTRLALNSWEQMRKGWFTFLFQLPFVPEQMLSAGNYSWLRQIITNNGSTPKEDVIRHVEVFSTPHALTCAVNYFRAAVQNAVLSRFIKYDPKEANMFRVDTPILIIWGEQDNFLEKDLARLSRTRFTDYAVVMLPQCSHWPMWENPAAVNQHLLNFLLSDLPATKIFPQYIPIYLPPLPAVSTPLPNDTRAVSYYPPLPQMYHG